MKRKIAGLCAFLIASSVSVSVLAAVKGDANNDGEITSKDLTRIGKYLMGTKELDEEQFSGADMDGNGIVNIVDYILEKEYLLSDENGGQTVVSVPGFSAESGFYENDFELTLTAAEGSTVYYTTDGSVPTTESEVYSAPLKITDRTSQPNVYSARTDVSSSDFIPSNVTKGTIVKAFAVDKDGNASEVVSKSYFVGIDIMKQYGGFPVVSLTIDPDDFFDYERGIYVQGKIYDEYVASGQSNPMQPWTDEANYTQRGKDWERRVYFEIF